LNPVELLESVVFFQLEPGQILCAKFMLVRVADVGASKPQPMTATDYYNPSETLMLSMSFINM